MLTHPTLDQLSALRLDGMAEAFAELQAQDGGRRSAPADWLGLLLDREVADRDTRRFRTRLRAAALRHVGAGIEDVDYRTPRGLDRALFQSSPPARGSRSAATCLITGPCGVGKTWLACALGQKACRDDRTVLYHRLPRLFADLELARGDGRFARLFRSLARVDLLILDDWGPDRLTAAQRRDLMEIVEDRYGAALDHRHQPAPRRRLARRHRRAHLRRRHPRPARPQRLPPRPRRPVDAQAQGRRRNPAGPAMTAARHLDARPRASTGPSRARRRVSPEIGTPRRARDPPIDDGDGLRRA